MFQIQGRTIKMINGDTGALTIKLNKVNPQTGQKEPLTFVRGDAVHLTVKEKGSAERKLYKKVTPVTGNQVTFGFLPSDTQNWKTKVYEYDVQVNLLDGTVDTVIGPAPLIIIGGVNNEC